MKIRNLKLTNLRNEEHFQFLTEFKTLVEEAGPEALGISEAFAIFLTLYLNEAEALNVVLKSTLTGKIADADQQRDDLVRGTLDTLKGAANHFLPEKREAAERLQNLFDRSGNISTKSYEEQTAAITALLEDITAGYTADATLLGLVEWLTALQAANDNLAALMAERYTEEAGRTGLKMKDTRKAADDAYRTITTRIDALIVVNGPEAYSDFVEQLNLRVDRYNEKIAQRRGRNANNGDGEEGGA